MADIWGRGEEKQAEKEKMCVLTGLICCGVTGGFKSPSRPRWTRGVELCCGLISDSRGDVPKVPPPPDVTKEGLDSQLTSDGGGFNGRGNVFV